MLKTSGHALVEFCVSIPILMLLLFPSVQLLYVSFQRLRMESLARQTARFLAIHSPNGADLTAAAERFTASYRPTVSCTVGRRNMTTLVSPAPRRPRSVDVIDVSLSSHEPFYFLAHPIELTAHAREFIWSMP